MAKSFTKEELDEIVNKYKTGEYNCHSLARELNISPMGVYRVLKRLGIKINNDLSSIARKYNVNQNYFDVIDCERKAYWLGLLFADGCNKDDRCEISIQLKDEDKPLLDEFRKDLDSNKPLHFSDINKRNPNWSNSYTLSINSKHMSSHLTKIGCVPRKSLILKFPTEEHVPRLLLKHFIRGYFDGDGCVSLSKSRRVVSVSLVSTEDFCCELAKIVKFEIDVNCSFSRKIRTDIETTSRALSVNGNIQAIKFLDWIYSDCEIMMNRKFLKYLECRQFLFENGLGNVRI